MTLLDTVELATYCVRTFALYKVLFMLSIEYIWVFSVEGGRGNCAWETIFPQNNLNEAITESESSFYPASSRSYDIWVATYKLRLEKLLRQPVFLTDVYVPRKNIPQNSSSFSAILTIMSVAIYTALKPVLWHFAYRATCPSLKTLGNKLNLLSYISLLNSWILLFWSLFFYDKFMQFKGLSLYVMYPY